MTVYAVWSGEYDAAVIVAVFATRALAESYIGNGLRRAWQREVDLTGQPIEGAGIRVVIREDDGKIAERRTVAQRYAHPGDFDEWCRAHGSGQWIEELDVLDALP